MTPIDELHDAILAAKQKIDEMKQAALRGPRYATEARPNSWLTIDKFVQVDLHHRALDAVGREADGIRDRLFAQGNRIWEAGWPQPPTTTHDWKKDMDELLKWVRDIISAQSTAKIPVQRVDSGGYLNETVASAAEQIRKKPGLKGIEIAKAISVTPEHFRSRIVPVLKAQGFYNKGGYQPPKPVKRATPALHTFPRQSHKTKSFVARKRACPGKGGPVVVPTTEVWCLMPYRFRAQRYVRLCNKSPPWPQQQSGRGAMQTRPAWRWDVAGSNPVGRIQ
jgi:hypothetical protein